MVSKNLHIFALVNTIADCNYNCNCVHTCETKQIKSLSSYSQTVRVQGVTEEQRAQRCQGKAMILLPKIFNAPWSFDNLEF